MKNKGFIIFPILLTLAALSVAGYVAWNSHPGADLTFGETQGSLDVFKKSGNSILPRDSDADFALDGTASASAALVYESSTNLLTLSNLTITGTCTGCSGGPGSGNVADGLDIAVTGGTYFAIASLQFDAGGFNFTNTASVGLVTIDYTNGPASRSATQNITGLWTFGNVGSATFAGSVNIAKSLTASRSFSVNRLQSTLPNGATALISLVASTAFSGGAEAIDFINGNDREVMARLSAEPGSSYNAPLFRIGVGNGTGTMTTRLTIGGALASAQFAVPLEIVGNASISSQITSYGTGSNSFSGSLNTTLGLHATTDVSAGGRFLGIGTGSNSFAGSLNLSKSLTATNSVTASNFRGTGASSSSFAGSLNTTLGIHVTTDVSAAGRFIGTGTVSNSFAGSLNTTLGVHAAGNITTTAAGAVGGASVGVDNGANSLLGIYRAGTNTLGLTNGVSGLSWNGTGFYPNTDSVRTLGLALTNRWLGIFAINASASKLEISGTASISDGVFVTSLKLPGSSGFTVGATSLGIDTASPSFNYHDGTNSRGIGLCDRSPSYMLKGTDLSAKNQWTIHLASFGPMRLKEIAVTASGTNSATWQLLTGSGTVPTSDVGTHQASGSSIVRYTTFTTASISKGHKLDLRVTSASATLESVLIQTCLQYDTTE